MNDRGARRARELPWAAILKSMVGVLVLVALFLALDPSGSWPPIVANAVLFLACLFLFTVLHEAGHALAARALGVPVWRVLVGSGPTVGAVRVAGTPWRFGAIPLGGVTFTHPEPGRFMRLQMWLIVLAGPLSNALALLVALPLASAHPSRALSPFWAVAAANAVLLCSSLVPLKTSTAYGTIATDGWQLLTLFFAPERRFTDLAGLPDVFAAEDAREAGDPEAALAACERGLAANPASVVLKNSRAVALLELERFEQAREEFLSLLADPDSNPDLHPVFENNVAWSNVMIDSDDLLEEADRLSRGVIQKCKRASWANGTRGAVLVCLGQPRRARAYLTRAWQTATDDHSRAHNAAWLAGAAELDGDVEEARTWFGAGEALNPKCHSLERVRALLRRTG